MHEADRYALTQMLRYSESAIQLLGARDEAALVADERTFFAVTYVIQTIGEAANRLSTGVRADLPRIPWPEIIGMRHHLVHGYDDIDSSILVKTIRRDLPPLIESLRQALEERSP